jgi:transcriptional regulator with XRE-family HTH domain
MSHSGEEFLCPIAGGVNYEFYWPRGDDFVLPVSVGNGDIDSGAVTAIRVLPNIPHRNWIAKDSSAAPALAWMVVRHLSGSRAPLESGPTNPSHHGDTEKIQASSLNDSTQAFLLLLDLPGRLKLARMRSGYSVTDLARSVSIHPSEITKMERGANNMSIHILREISKVVGLELTHITAPRYFGSEFEGLGKKYFDLYQPYSVTRTKEEDNRPVKIGNSILQGVTWRPLLQSKSEYDHWMHGHVISMAEGATIPLACDHAPYGGGPYLDSYLGEDGKQSWIVLVGEVTLETMGSVHSPSMNPVVHVNNCTNAVFRAYRPSILLHIECSTMCSCAEGPRVKPGSSKPKP